MQIKKINDDKLKVILSISDLNKNNIDVDSFLSSSIESQNLFFEILDLAEEKYDFNIEDNKAIVEAVSLDNNIFVLTITRLKNTSLALQNTDCNVYCFENVEDIMSFYSCARNYSLNLSSICLYSFKNKYYILLKKHDTFFENILLEYSTPQTLENNLKDILVEYGTKIKDL